MSGYHCAVSGGGGIVADEDVEEWLKRADYSVSADSGRRDNEGDDRQVQSARRA
jgi:hypothetical protein